MTLNDASSLTGTEVIALIPAYNEGKKIAAVIEQTRAYLPVLVVDDGSKDNTADQAEKSGAVVVRQVPNQGKGAALKNGFRWAVDHNVGAVIMLDADGQHAPNEIPRFLEKYHAQRSDLIIGEREYGKMPPVRRFTNHIGRWTFSWAMGQYIPDNQSGYRLVSNPLMRLLLDSQEQGFHFEVEMIMTCVKNDLRLDWVPISTIYADEHSHINPIEHVPNFFRVVLKTRREMQAARRAKNLARN